MLDSFFFFLLWGSCNSLAAQIGLINAFGSRGSSLLIVFFHRHSAGTPMSDADVSPDPQPEDRPTARDHPKGYASCHAVGICTTDRN